MFQIFKEKPRFPEVDNLKLHAPATIGDGLITTRTNRRTTNRRTHSRHAHPKKGSRFSAPLAARTQPGDHTGDA